MESEILKGLNKAQYDAVVNYDTPSLIIAGAGSGKTRVLTSRIAYMLEQGVQPHNILALTFTNKAAEQMRTRIEQMVGGASSRRIRMGTFHSVFSRILRENADRIGYPQSFTIYEPSDCKNLIKTICKEMNLADDKYKPNKVLSRISFAKNCLVTPAAYAANASYAAEDRQMQMPRFGEIYDTYCRRAKQNGAMDFDDLLLQTNFLLRDCPDVLARYQELFQYILVDEYQDTNYAQYIIIRRLSQLHSRVCVVGDDAQSIYSFRGAKIENILSFRNDYPTAQVFKLEQNYRSTRTIVNAANSVIERNSRRMDKKCFSDGDAGELIKVIQCSTPREESKVIANSIKTRLQGTDDKFGEVAILYRNNEQSKDLEDALNLYRIPYLIYKGRSFYESKEIKDVLAYMRLIVNRHDDEAFKRVVNYPMRGIGDTTVKRIEQLANDRGMSMWDTVDYLVKDTISLTDPMLKTIVRKVAEFVNLIRYFSEVQHSKDLYDFGLEVVSKSGILGLYNEKAVSKDLDEVKDGKAAISNLESLLNSMKEFSEQREAEIRNGELPDEDKPTIDGWMQNIMLLTDMDEKNNDDNNRVTLMTVHSAKGLEYKYVYIVGMEENLFPSQRAMETADGLEEERRLFYVALTRAKQEAMLSYCEMRFKWGNMEFSQPSRFLREIDPQYVETDEDLSPRASGGRPSGDADGFGSADGRTGGRIFGDPARGGYAARSGYGGSRSGYGGQRSAYGSDRSAERRDGRTAIEELRRRFDVRFQQKREQAASGGERKAPDPRLVAQPPQPRNTEGMRRIPTVQRNDAAPAAPCAYSTGDRVEHPKFGAGVIVRIESMATDHKLVVDFGQYGEKTLLAKFAKLVKL